MRNINILQKRMSLLIFFKNKAANYYNALLATSLQTSTKKSRHALLNPISNLKYIFDQK